MVGWLGPAAVAAVGGLTAQCHRRWRQIPYLGALAMVAVLITWKMSRDRHDDNIDEKAATEATSSSPEICGETICDEDEEGIAPTKCDDHADGESDDWVSPPEENGHRLDCGSKEVVENDRPELDFCRQDLVQNGDDMVPMNQSAANSPESRDLPQLRTAKIGEPDRDVATDGELGSPGRSPRALGEMLDEAVHPADKHARNEASACSSASNPTVYSGRSVSPPATEGGVPAHGREFGDTDGCSSAPKVGTKREQSPTAVKRVIVEDADDGTEVGRAAARREYNDRLRSYDEYLADPDLSPTMREQVLRAKASITRYFVDSDDDEDDE